MNVSNPAQLSPGFQSLFPAGVVAAELRGPGAVSLLLPDEAACLGSAVPKRAQEFAAGRLCARRALEQLGVVNFALVAAPDRQPVWPGAVVGSITHTAGLCAAVAVERRRFLGVGVDIEIVGHVTDKLWPKICVPAERAWITTLPDTQRAAAAALVFAAKEAFYKCQFPLVGQWLGFEDLCIEAAAWGPTNVEGATAVFRVNPTRRIAVANRVALPVLGRYRFHEEFVSAGVALEA
jgi:4'-phosphopantetheinyl transferase EntD